MPKKKIKELIKVEKKLLKSITKRKEYKAVLKQYKKAQKFALNNKAISIAAVVSIALALLVVFPFRFILVPAIVNGQPIFSWKYVAELHKKAGPQVLEQLVNEALIQQEITKQNIIISQEEIDEQIAQIESQLGAEGSLDTILSFQGLTRDQFIKNLRLNLSLEKLVKNNVEVTEEEIQTELDSNPASYIDLSETDSATQAAEAVRQQKMPDLFNVWFQDLKDNAKIKNFLGSPEVVSPQL